MPQDTRHSRGLWHEDVGACRKRPLARVYDPSCAVQQKAAQGRVCLSGAICTWIAAPLSSPATVQGLTAEMAPAQETAAAQDCELDILGPCYSSSAASPSSPRYDPRSPVAAAAVSARAPSSRMHVPASPYQTPLSPVWAPTSPGYAPTSPAHAPAGPQNPFSSPVHATTSPDHAPTSPAYAPRSPDVQTGKGSTMQSGADDRACDEEEEEEEEASGAALQTVEDRLSTPDCEPGVCCFLIKCQLVVFSLLMRKPCPDLITNSPEKFFILCKYCRVQLSA